MVVLFKQKQAAYFPKQAAYILAFVIGVANSLHSRPSHRRSDSGVYKLLTAGAVVLIKLRPFRRENDEVAYSVKASRATQDR